MSRRSINCLPRADAEYRQAARRCIETEEAAQQEDTVRARLLRAVAASGSHMVNSEHCANMAAWLDQTASKGIPLRSRASARRMRQHRIDIASSLHQLIDRSGLEARTFTLVSSSWTVPASSLPSIDPNDLLNGVRSDFIRASVDLNNGALFMAIDGAFERNRSLYQLHVNGLALGTAIDAIDELRALDKYRRVESCTATTWPIYRPIVVSRQALTNLPSTLAYRLKHYWPCTWLPMDGSTNRSRSEQRIPEPYHSQWLLWMDRWELGDLTLLMGMFVGNGGFTLTNGRNPADPRLPLAMQPARVRK